MIQTTHYVSDNDGWLLALKQTYDPEKLRPDRRPLAIVPGYGMNAFIFGYHPTGASMEAFWADRGFEVWSLNLRAQGGSRREGGSRKYGFYDAAVTDLTCAFEYIVRHTETGADRVDGVGCSLGGTYLYVYAAFAREKSRLGSLVSMGAPLRWDEVHPALKAVCSSPALVGQLRMRGTRKLVQLALPALKRLPRLLHLYMHPEIIDISRMGEMVQTVEDPNPVLNREIAEWVGARDLYVKGINVTDGVAAAENPLLIVLANADGIVPEPTALSAYHAMASPVKEVLRVGTDAVPVAHADLFISEISHEWVFEPLADWLEAQYRAAPAGPVRKPARKDPVEKPAKKESAGKAARNEPARKPAKKDPDKIPAKRKTARKPARKAPTNRSAKKTPAPGPGPLD
jgi:pimeloyl-ACP methyl ester carboxylesterase